MDNNEEEEAMIVDVVSGVLKEGEPADKAVKSENLAIPEHLLDDCIISKLTEHWKSDKYKYKGEGPNLQDPFIRNKVKKGLRGL